MQALDLTKVKLSKFSFYYIAFVLVYLLIFLVIENRFFPNPEIPFTSGVLVGFAIQFLILNLRIYLMQRNWRFGGEIQIAFSFLSLLINLAVLILLSYSANNFSLIFGFFIAHNLNILNIALITNLAVKKND